MSNGRPSAYLAQMRQASFDCQAFVEGLTKDQFLADKRTQQAAVMSLLIIGEAASRVLERYPHYAASHCGVPWQDMKGMRNRIAHGYFEMNFDVVWDTIQTALPTLLVSLDKLLQTE